MDIISLVYQPLESTPLLRRGGTQGGLGDVGDMNQYDQIELRRDGTVDSDLHSFPVPEARGSASEFQETEICPLSGHEEKGCRCCDGSRGEAGKKGG